MTTYAQQTPPLTLMTKGQPFIRNFTMHKKICMLEYFLRSCWIVFSYHFPSNLLKCLLVAPPNTNILFGLKDVVYSNFSAFMCAFKILSCSWVTKIRIEFFHRVWASSKNLIFMPLHLQHTMHLQNMLLQTSIDVLQHTKSIVI